MAINKVMVLGAGTMGMGIAQVFAEAGKTVIVRDIADAFIQRGEGVLKKNMEKKVPRQDHRGAEERDPGPRFLHPGAGRRQGLRPGR